MFATPTRRWRKATAALGMVALFVLGTAASASAAPPYATDATIDSIAFTQSTVESGSDARLTGSWTLPDNPTSPAGFVVDLPAGLQGLTDNFDLTTPAGEVMGSCVVTNTQIICDFDAAYLSAHPLNLRGTFDFWAKVTTTVTEDTVTNYDFGDVSASVTVTPAGDACPNGCEFTGRDSAKSGFYNREQNEIQWTVVVGAPATGMAGGDTITVTDTPGPQQQMMGPATTTGDVYQSNEIVVTDGRAAPGNFVQMPADQVQVSADGRQVTFTSQKGYFYEVKFRTKVLDAGALKTYTNNATITIGSEEPISVNGQVVKQGGSGTGIGDDVGRFTIEKIVEGPAADLDGLTFSGTYLVTLSDGTTVPGTFTVAAGQTWTSPDYPKGSMVHITEDPPTNTANIEWESHAFSVNDFTLAGGTLVPVTLTNVSELSTASFSAQKKLVGTAASQVSPSATFVLEYSYPAGDNFPAGSGTLELAVDGTIAHSPALPVGAHVTIKETPPAVIAGTVWKPAQLSLSEFDVTREDTVRIVVTNTLDLVPPTPTPTATPAPTSASNLARTGGGPDALIVTAGVALLVLGLGAYVIAAMRERASRGEMVETE